MQRRAAGMNWIVRGLAALTLAICLTVPATQTTAEPVELFAPIPAQATPTNFTEALRVAKILGPTQGLDALSADQQAAIRAIKNAQTNPSMATAVALLSHFATFADTDNDLFRRSLAQADVALPALLMADVAKYHLILQTNKNIHAQEKHTGGIEVSLRVGSTGRRFAQLQQWAVAHKHTMDGSWDYIDPWDSSENRPFKGMPIDDRYRDAKLLSADDDLTNWASLAARLADPLANENLNGKRAAEVFTALTRKILDTLPAEMRGDVRNGMVALGPADMMIEFLSPTHAVNIMASEKRRKEKGWDAILVPNAEVHFLGAWIVSDLQKYNGLYASEQLHAWGMEKGYVTENVADPLADNSSIKYSDSATGGKLKTITGADIFPKGVKDPFGWMATNYRQIFVTHSGDLDSLAKYTERMIDWWGSVDLPIAELKDIARATPTLDGSVMGSAEFTRLDTLARALRNAEDADTKKAAIAGAGGKDKAIAGLKRLNEAMMVSGQRKHLQQLAEGITVIMREDIAERTLGDRIDKPLTFQEIIAKGDARRKAKKGKDDPYVAFQTSINAYASGYANLPADIAQKMAVDIAQFVDQDLLLPNGKGQVSAELRLYLLPVLKTGAERARAVGTDLREDAEGLRRLADLAKSDLGKAIGQKLQDLNEPDLHGYLKKLKNGEITRRQLRLLADSEGGWPKVQVVEQIWRPADLGNDLKRLMWLGEKLGWSDATYAHRLAATINGPDYRAPSLPGEPPTNERAYSEMAVEAFLAFTRMADRASSTTQFIKVIGSNGEVFTKQIRGSNFSDAEMNVLLIALEHLIRGNEKVAKIWGLKGDVEGLTSFATTLHALTAGNPDQTEAEKARAIATLVSEAYGTFPALAENFGNPKWADWIETNMGGKSSVLGKAGGTIGAALSNADTAFQTPEAQEALYGAIITDLLIVWQPHLATGMAAYAAFKTAKSYVWDDDSNRDLIDLLAQNGVWNFDVAGRPPILEAFHMGDLIVTDNAAGRNFQCALRAKSSIAPSSDIPKIDSIEMLLRLDPAIPADGISLCERIEGKKCVTSESSRKVHPRTSALALYDASGMGSNDPVITPIKDSINSMVGWGFVDPLRTFVTFDSGTNWSSDRLATHGIFPPTPEDAPFVLRDSIRVEIDKAEYRTLGSATRRLSDAGVLHSIGKGGRKMLGYMASQHWVRRQYLMECVMLEPWIQAAALQAQKNSYKGMAMGNVAAKLAGLDQRLRALDKRVWPQIAKSYQPYPVQHDGKPFPDKQRFAIYDHYLQASANPRRDLRDIVKWFAGEQRPDNVPAGPLSRALTRQSIGHAGDLGNSESADLVRATMTDEARLKEDQLSLTGYAESLLADITELVVKYESGFDAVLKRIHATRKYVASGDGYKLGPVHVAIMAVGSYAPDVGTYGDVKDHIFPDSPWQAANPIDHAAIRLLSGLNIRDSSGQLDGSVGAALRAWDFAYQEVRKAAREAIEPHIDPFKITLMEEKETGTEAHFSEKTLQFQAMLGLPTADLSVRHPLFPRILRQAFQAHKISLVTAQKDRVTKAEIKTVAAAMKPDGNKSGKIDATTMEDLIQHATVFHGKVAKLTTLVGDLFEITFHGGDPTKTPFVSAELTRDFVATPHKDPKLPTVTDDDLKAWIDQVYWEVARKPDFDGSIIRPELDPNRDIRFAPGVLNGLAHDQTMPLLTTCNAKERDPDYENRVSVLPGAPDEKKALKLPLVSPGNYYLRATALSSGNVPLARKTISFEVAPAELRGRLIVTGGGIDVRQGQKVQVNVGGLPWWEARAVEIGNLNAGIAAGQPDDVHPVITLYQAGLFRVQLCGSLSHTMLNRDSVLPVLIPVGEAAKNINARGYFFPEQQIADTGDIVASKAVASVVLEPGVFGLEEPVEIVLDAAEAVAVKVEVRDASDKLITAAQTTVTAGDQTLSGSGPFELSLAVGDLLAAHAALKVLGGTARGDSEPLAFSVADHSGGVTLKTKVPAYVRGNLRVTGQFVLPTGLERLRGVGGGEMWSNLLPKTGKTVLGSSFGFTNDNNVALVDGISLEASLVATDAIETFLVAQVPATGSAVIELTAGGTHELGDIKVAILKPKEVDLRVGFVDWTGRPLSVQLVKAATLDGAAMTLAANGYTGKAQFEGRSDRKTIKVEYQTIGGRGVAELEISGAILGDPTTQSRPDPIEMRLPIYAPGSLRLTGTSDIVTAQFTDKTPPATFEVGIQSQPPVDSWQGQVGSRFLFDLTFPVAVGDIIEVAGRTRIGLHSFKGHVTAAAPKDGSGNPVLLDVGAIRFEKFLDLIPMPALVGMNIDRVLAQFGDDFSFQVHRKTEAPTPQDVGKVHVQAPVQHSDAKPSLVPRGMTVSLAVYDAKALYVLGNFTGFEVTRAQQSLADSGVVNVITVLGKPALEGEEPNLVVQQTPPPGTQIDPRHDVVTLYYSAQVIAKVVPVEDDPPPKETEDPPPDDVDDPPPDEPVQPATDPPDQEGDDGPGALELLRVLVPKIDRMWVEEDVGRTTLAHSTPTGDYTRATVSFDITTTNHTNDVPSSEVRMKVGLIVQKFDSAEAARPVVRSDEEWMPVTDDLLLEIPLVTFSGEKFERNEAEGKHVGLARFALGKFQFEVTTREVSFVELNEQGESDRGFPFAEFAALIMTHVISLLMKAEPE